MNTAPTFRLATPADALCIGALGTQVWLDTYATDGIRPALAKTVTQLFSEPAIAVTLQDDNRVIVLAEKAGHLIGFAQFKYSTGHTLISAPSTVELERLYVQERFTGTGVGKALLRQTEELVCKDGKSALWLTAWVGNPRALAFYTRQGYEDIGTTGYCFEGEEHENRVFMKRIS
ncbi:MAG: GNAT family N-acetyltransferase [Pseudomonas sp.]